MIKFWFGITLLSALVWLKAKYDPNNDAFRTKERKGWCFKKAPIIDLMKWKKKHEHRSTQN